MTPAEVKERARQLLLEELQGGSEQLWLVSQVNTATIESRAVYVYARGPTMAHLLVHSLGLYFPGSEAMMMPEAAPIPDDKIGISLTRAEFDAIHLEDDE